MSFDRRQLLQSALGAYALTSPWQTWAANPDPSSHALVVVFLRGAVDGLNVLVPYADPEYYRLRPTIAVARPGEANGALDLNGRFGLHPALAALKPLWDQEQLGFVCASGSPDPTRSHFDAQDYMETATPGVKSTSSGWLNRLAAQLPDQRLLKALNIGTNLPRALAGPHQVAVLGSGNQATQTTALDREPMQQSLQRLYANDPQLKQLTQDAIASRRDIMTGLTPPLEEGMDPKADVGAITASGFAQDAARLGMLMRRDSSIRLAFAAVGGWDTHVNQGAGTGQLANRLQSLGDGLALLVKQLGERYRETTIMVMSEFGRTARQNGSQGTDHGHGNTLWLLGGKVQGGKIHGWWPGLDSAALYEGRDLAVTTDFRSVLSSACGGLMRLPDQALNQVFPVAPKGLESQMQLWRT